MQTSAQFVMTDFPSRGYKYKLIPVYEKKLLAAYGSASWIHIFHVGYDI